MRHEVLTPLNAIVGFSQLIVDSIHGDQRADMGKYLSIIAENNDILHTVITDIIDISQLDTGEMGITYHPESLMKYMHSDNHRNSSESIEKSKNVFRCAGRGFNNIQ